MSQLVDMCVRSKVLTLPFELNIDKWKTIDKDVKDAIFSEWHSIKFLNEDATQINQDIVQVPNDRGGVYMFLLRPDVIPGLHRYIMYIGRARRQKQFSLRKRCRAYLTDMRPKVATMRELWGKDLYFYYLPLDDDDFIDKTEKELLRVIIPPCNSDIPEHYYAPDQPMF